MLSESFQYSSYQHWVFLSSWVHFSQLIKLRVFRPKLLYSSMRASSVQGFETDFWQSVSLEDASAALVLKLAAGSGQIVKS